MKSTVPYFPHVREKPYLIMKSDYTTYSIVKNDEPWGPSAVTQNRPMVVT